MAQKHTGLARGLRREVTASSSGHQRHTHVRTEVAGDALAPAIREPRIEEDVCLWLAVEAVIVVAWRRGGQEEAIAGSVGC